MDFDYEYWAGKTVLITGGTGSFGRAFLNACIRFLPVGEVRIFSRDEKKQADIRASLKYEKTDTQVKYIVGDVRDREAVDQAMVGVDYVFHEAALKHVATGEDFPMEVVKTNILGSNNVIESAIRNGVKKVVVLSTDKAVNPTCAMGMAKGLMEKCALARCNDSDTQICVTRFGNVMGSRGSAIPLFADQIRRGVPVTVTDTRMLRYMMSMSQAIELVGFAFEHGRNGETIVLNCPVASVFSIACAVSRALDPTNKQIPAMTTIGIRPGEKMSESLMTDEELQFAYHHSGNIYVIPMTRCEENRISGDDPLLHPVVLSPEELAKIIIEQEVLE